MTGLRTDAEVTRLQVAYDRAEVACDEAAEAELYRLLVARLPHAAIVSIGHRSSLVQFHGRFFELQPDAGGRHHLTPTGRNGEAEAEDELGVSLA